MQIDQGFAPLLSESVPPRVLVLGTLPGVRSLEDVQYYAHPQNSFWWIMSELFGFDLNLPYQERVDIVNNRGVMVWDVIHSCHRPGSLDSSIDQDTLKANDFEGLLAEYPSLSMIAFNGQAARKLFKKHVEKEQTCDLSELILKVMPSTSPAHASMRKEQKLDNWREMMECLS